MTVRPCLLLALPLILLVGCTSGGGADIEVGTVTRATVVEIVEAPATVAAKASAVVASPANGRIETLEIEEGQRVNAGDLLLEIDSPEAREQLEQARAAHEEAEQSGSVSVPTADFSRTQSATDEAAADAFANARAAATQIPDDTTREALLAQVAQSEAAYEAVSADARAAVRDFNAGLASVSEALRSLSAAQRAQAEAALTLAERRVEALTIRAPISGTITLSTGNGQAAVPDLGGILESLPPEAGDLLGGADGVAPGQNAVPARPALDVGMPVSTGMPLLSIVDISDLSLAAEVDETDVLLVEPGVPAQIELDAVLGARYPATVESVDLAPTSSTRGGVSYVVRLSLGTGAMPDGSVAPEPRPGMSAVAALEVRTDQNAVAVPSSALIREGDRDTVWLLVEGRARRRIVTLGAQGEDLVAVETGLEVGQEIVVRGADQVSEGDEIS